MPIKILWFVWALARGLAVTLSWDKGYHATALGWITVFILLDLDGIREGQNANR